VGVSLVCRTGCLDEERRFVEDLGQEILDTQAIGYQPRPKVGTHKLAEIAFRQKTLLTTLSGGLRWGFARV